MKNILLLVVLLVYTYGIAISQPPRGPLVISPQVHPDNKVTFRYMAPSAKEVKLNPQFEKAPIPMTKSLRVYEV